MTRPWYRLVIFALIAAGLVFCSAPWFAFRALRAAARAEDYQALGELIDYNTVREGLRAEVQAGGGAAATPAPDFWHDPLGALNRAVAPLKPAPGIDALLTPRALVAMTDGERHPGRDSAWTKALDLIPGPDGRVIRYWDPNRCRIAVKTPDGRESLFTFERHGLLTWKLVQLRPPHESLTD